MEIQKKISAGVAPRLTRASQVPWTGSDSECESASFFRVRRGSNLRRTVPTPQWKQRQDRLSHGTRDARLGVLQK